MTSAVVGVGVKVLVTIHVSTAHPRKGKRIKVYGSVQPPKPGAVVSVQRKSNNGRYETIKRTTSVALNGARSTYSVRVAINGKRRLRVLVRPADGGHLPGTSMVRGISPR